MEIVVSKGNHQGYNNREDNRKCHGNVRWDNEQVWESIFIDTFNHILKCQWDRDAIIDTFCNSVSVFNIENIKG